MPTIEKPEPHALARLRERHDVRLTPEDLRRLALAMTDPTTRSDATRFRFIAEQAWGSAIWLVCLRDSRSRAAWVPLIFDPVRVRIATALAWPVGLPVERAEAVLVEQYGPQSKERKGA